MLRVSITVPAEASEDVLDVLLELIPPGVHEHEPDQGVCQLDWYGEHGELPSLGEIEAALGNQLLSWTTEEVDADPVARRRRFGQAWVVGGRLAVRGPDDPPAPDGMDEVVIEAMSGEFGTGAHPTTRACLQMLLDLEPRGSFADLGCGAGVLAITAAQLGFEPVFAIDILPASVRATVANAARNGVTLAAAELDLAAAPPPSARTLAANVPLWLHRKLAGELTPEVDTMLVSGVIRGDGEEAVAAYAAAGLQEVRRIEGDGWINVVMRRNRT